MVEEKMAPIHPGEILKQDFMAPMGISVLLLKVWRLQASRPQGFKINFDFLEGFYPHLVVVAKAAEQIPSAGFESEGIHGHGKGIDQPNMSNAMQAVERHFLDFVITKGAWREDLAHPVGGDRNPVEF